MHNEIPIYQADNLLFKIQTKMSFKDLTSVASTHSHTKCKGLNHLSLLFITEAVLTTYILLDLQALDDLDLDNFDLEDIDTTDVNLDDDFLND